MSLATSSSASSPLRPGVNAMLRKVAVAAASKPHVEIRQDGDQFYIKTSTTVRTTEINFKIGESFEEETVDGRKCRVRGELCVRCLLVCAPLEAQTCCPGCESQCVCPASLPNSSLGGINTSAVLHLLPPRNRGGWGAMVIAAHLIQHSLACRTEQS